MRRHKQKKLNVLVVDVGGAHVKFVSTRHKNSVKFRSGSKLTPKYMLRQIFKRTEGWHFDAVSIGYPGVVRDGRIAREPHNLGTGWVGFDFQAAFGCPVKLINDAAMQAFGSYKRGTLLFLGLGTGLGSALIVDGTIAAMELGHLHYADRHTYEHFLGRAGLKRLGHKKWSTLVEAVVKGFRDALLPDEVVLGGGNAKKLKRLPSHTRRGRNADAFAGGFRLWPQKTR